MSGLWTPGGENVPSNASPEVELGERPLTEEERVASEEFAAMRDELARTAVLDMVANHVVGLWQLAVLHLGLDGERPPNLAEAALAVDAMGALVEGLGPKLADHETTLREALAQLRLAYVQVNQIVNADAPSD